MPHIFLPLHLTLITGSHIINALVGVTSEKNQEKPQSSYQSVKDSLQSLGFLSPPRRLHECGADECWGCQESCFPCKCGPYNCCANPGPGPALGGRSQSCCCSSDRKTCDLVDRTCCRDCVSGSDGLMNRGECCQDNYGNCMMFADYSHPHGSRYCCQYNAHNNCVNKNTFPHTCCTCYPFGRVGPGSPKRYGAIGCCMTYRGICCKAPYGPGGTGYRQYCGLKDGTCAIFSPKTGHRPYCCVSGLKFERQWEWPTKNGLYSADMAKSCIDASSNHCYQFFNHSAGSSHCYSPVGSWIISSASHDTCQEVVAYETDSDCFRSFWAQLKHHVKVPGRCDREYKGHPLEVLETKSICGAAKGCSDPEAPFVYSRTIATSAHWIRNKPSQCERGCTAASGGGKKGTVTCLTNSCDKSKKPHPKMCPKPPACPMWVLGEPTSCTNNCGSSGGGNPGKITCPSLPSPYWGSCDEKQKPAPKTCPKPPMCGVWIRDAPTKCITECGIAAGTGNPGVVTCSTSSCDHAKKPWPRICPKPEPCVVVQPTVPYLDATLNTDRTGGQYFTVVLNLDVTNVGMQSYKVIVDCGSTGLVVVPPGPVKRITNEHCHDHLPCQKANNGWQYTQCFADLSGYMYYITPSKATLTLPGHSSPVKVTFADSDFVYDPDDSMYDSKTETYTNIWGLGGYGENACTYFKTDLLKEYTKGAKLILMFSLRSVTSTGEARLYVGTIDPAFQDKLYAPVLIDPYGHYVVSLTGVKTSSAEVLSSLATAEKAVVDTGSSATILTSDGVMQQLLTALQAVCDGSWIRAAPSFGNAPRGDQFVQYSCHAAKGWENHAVIFVFGEAETPLLPVTNMVAHNPSDDKVYLQVVHNTRPGAQAVLGMALFLDNWVEINIDAQHMRFADPTSEQSHWGLWSDCPCATTDGTVGMPTLQTRSCHGGDGKWCLGPSSQTCKKACQSCPKTCNGETCNHWFAEKSISCDVLETQHGCDCHGCACSVDANGEAEWTEWSPCTVTCGEGIQGRDTVLIKAGTGNGVVMQPNGKTQRPCKKEACSSCLYANCATEKWCPSCTANNYQSCTSCNPGCTLRVIDSAGNHDCKGTGEWGPVPTTTNNIVVVHGRSLRGSPIASL